jgi:hypothetical protein
MLRRSLFGFAALGLALFGVPAAGALALSVPLQAPAVEAGSSQLRTDVRGDGGGYRGGSGYRGGYGKPRSYPRYRYKGYPRYNQYRHGYRCNGWSNNCRHYYRGYWYQNPWWTYPAIGFGIGLGAGAYYYDDYYVAPRARGYGSRHVRWCLDRYRSYNPRTNTWVAYSGRVNQCVSPYGP